MVVGERQGSSQDPDGTSGIGPESAALVVFLAGTGATRLTGQAISANGRHFSGVTSTCS